MADTEPNVGAGRPRPFGEHLRRSGEDVLHGVRTGHLVRELRKHLVRRGPLAVDQPVGEPLGPIPNRVEGQGDQGRGPEGKERVPSRADGCPDTDDHRHIHGREEGSEKAVDDGLVDDHVDLVQAVAQDRQGRRRWDQEGEPDAKSAGEHRVRECGAQAGGGYREDEEAHRDAGGVGEPLELLALLSAGPAQANQESHDREDEQEDDHQKSGAAREPRERPDADGIPHFRQVWRELQGCGIEGNTDSEPDRADDREPRRPSPPSAQELPVGEQQEDQDQSPQSRVPDRVLRPGCPPHPPVR